MTAFQTIRIEQDTRGVARLMLARAGSHNALDAAMIRELRAAVAKLGADPSVRVVVLAADGKSFCAGADLNWMRDMAGKDRAGKLAEASELAHLLRDLNTLPKPVIARVHGSAYGGGVGLMSVCDVVIVADSARFALTEVRLGLIPATIAPYVIARIGEAAARRMILTGSVIDAAEAKLVGLASIVTTGDTLDSTVAAEIGACLMSAPGAIADAKALCLYLARNIASDPSGLTAARLADRWETDEARAGMDSFLSRQASPWAANTEESGA